MKTKQLANVLIKILGLSLCSQSVMHFINSLLNLYYASSMRVPAVLSGNLLSGAILAGIGVCFILKSREIAGVLFKNEAD